jgi:hypothetical protein
MKQKLKRNQRYFKDVDISKYGWIRNAFAINSVSGLVRTCNSQPSCDGSLKDMAGTDKVPKFWLLVKTTIRVYQTKK